PLKPLGEPGVDDFECRGLTDLRAQDLDLEADFFKRQQLSRTLTRDIDFRAAKLCRRADNTAVDERTAGASDRRARSLRRHRRDRIRLEVKTSLPARL